MAKKGTAQLLGLPYSSAAFQSSQSEFGSSSCNILLVASLVSLL